MRHGLPFDKNLRMTSPEGAVFWEVLQLCRSALISLADMVLASSVAGLFKWRQFEPEMILLAVGWYLRFSLSYRDVEELLAERGLLVDHVAVWRWVQRYAPQIQRRLRPRLRQTNDSWRVDSDLHPGQGQVGVFIPGCRLQRCDDRLPSVG